MAKDAKLTIPLNLEISKDSYEKLAAARKTQGDESLTGWTLGVMCSQMLDAYANGGLMVKPDSKKQLEAACATSIGTESQLVAAVQKAHNRDEGQNVVTIKIDDSIFPAIEEYSKTVGMTVKEVVDDMAHRMVRDSLAFYVSNQNYEPVVYLTEAQGRRLEKILSKRHINGDDILNIVEKALVAA
jgi:hypothetical protein